jgi:hypothetical protein
MADRPTADATLGASVTANESLLQRGEYWVSLGRPDEEVSIGLWTITELRVLSDALRDILTAATAGEGPYIL